MRLSSGRQLRGGLAALLLSASSPAFCVNAEPADMDVDLAAKVAREKAKIKRDQHEAGKDSLLGSAESASADCGSVNIGNVSNDKGRIGAVPQNNTVVITGPVINVGNKCK